MKQKLRHPYSRFFGTLANQIRLDILMHLQKGEKNVNSICESMKMKQPTVSKNLARLEECGFVACKKMGKERVYSINQETIGKVMVLMNNHVSKYCCHVEGD